MFAALLALPFLALAQAAPASAADHTFIYVNAATGNDNNICTTPSTPCKTLIMGFNESIPGGTVYIYPGTYNIQTQIETDLNVVGVSGNPADVVITPGTPGDLADYPVFFTQTALGNGAPTVHITNVTITGAQDSAIVNGGTLTLTNDAITGNASTDAADNPSLYSSRGKGGGIYNEGVFATLTLDHTVVSNNHARYGGGIENENNLNVDHSTISGNVAMKGGGINGGYGHTSIHSSAITGNQASSGSNIFSGEGGGVSQLAGTLDIADTTIAGNSATYVGGGVETDSLSGTFTNDTIADNTVTGYPTTTDFIWGGGLALEDIAGGSSINLVNTILAGNHGDINADCYFEAGRGAIHDFGHNLVGDNEGCTSFVNDQNSDLVGTAANRLDAHLGALASNGGPTQTMAIDMTSPAFGAGDANTCNNIAIVGVDQRDATRRTATRGVCDIGAYDTGLIAPPVPVNVEAFSTSGAMDVSWEAPPNYALPISYYLVTCNPDCGGTQQTTNTFINLTNLTVGTSYTFRVSAVSSGGQGPYSPPSNAASFATPPGVPNFVDALLNGTTVDLSWSPPVNTTGAGVGWYSVLCHPNIMLSDVNGNPVNCTSMLPVAQPGLTMPMTRHIRLYNLPRGVTIQFGVIASNDVGTSYEGLSNAITVPLAPGKAAVSLAPSSDSGRFNYDRVTNAGRPTFVGTADAGSLVDIYDGTTILGTTAASSTGAFSFVPLANLTNGTHSITASVTNSSGTTTSDATSIVVDRSIPTAPVVTATVAGRTATVTWPASTDDAAPMSVYTVTATPGGATQTVVSTGTGMQSTTFGGLTNGTTYSFSVTATNLAGTTGPAGTSNDVTVPLPPSITKVSPAYGAPGGGTKVTIKGVRLGDVTGVSFGSAPATSFKAAKTGTTITAVAPAGTGTVDVTVTSPAGTSATSAADRFSYAPAVNKVSPAKGPRGTSVTITGKNFAGARLVVFGDNAADSFTIVSNTKIVAVAGAGTGTVDVQVVVGNMVSATNAHDHFTFQ